MAEILDYVEGVLIFLLVVSLSLFGWSLLSFGNVVENPIVSTQDIVSETALELRADDLPQAGTPQMVAVVEDAGENNPPVIDIYRNHRSRRSSSGSSGGSSNTPASFKSAASVRQMVAEEGSARVIVNLNDVGKAGEVLSQLGSFEKAVDMKKGFAGYVDAAALAALENSPVVDFIYEDRPLQIASAESFPLINADKAANVDFNGFANLTGEGQTVCVIDTGVDYYHDDLGDCTYAQFINGNCPKVIGGYDLKNTDDDPVDDNGHGTAMAGLIAGNGAGYKGIAPEAKIIALKVTDASGNGWASIAQNAIDWCVDNASKYNITVISFGLHSSGFSTNNPADCASPDPIGAAIENAFDNNLSVFVPTGNDEYTNGIGYPACVSEAIAISAVSDGSGGSVAGQDEIPDSSTADGWGPNRYPGMTDLMAPGQNIDVIWMSEGSRSNEQGTSYASAHAVGSAILLREYYDERYSVDLSPVEIKNILQVTGKDIWDADTSANYSRIDVLKAVNYEEYDPVVVLETANDSTVAPGIVTLEYNVNDDHNVVCSLYINAALNQTDNTITRGVTQSFSVTLAEAVYTWQVICDDNATVSNQGTSETRTINVQSSDTTPPSTITSLTSTSKSTDYIYWEWTNPTDGDFAENIVFIDSVNVINTSNNYYNATGLSPDTSYTITVHTKDTNGNVNNTDVSDAVTTDSVIVPGGYLQVLSQTPDTDVTKDGFFSFSIDVKCLNGSCSNVVLTLDPWEDYNFTEEEMVQAQEELEEINNRIAENNLDWNAELTPAFVDYVRRENNGEIPYVEPEEEPTIKKRPSSKSSTKSIITQKDEKIFPYFFDWRNAYGENWVTPAKNQGGCASCWAFAPVAVTESALSIYNRWPSLGLDLSEQDMVSCSGSGNCVSGGSDNTALSYIRDTGVVDETCFPYSATDEACANKCSDGTVYQIQDKFTVIDGGGDAVDKQAVITNILKYGTSTAQIRAYTDLYSYSSGIYEPSVGTNNGAHIINVVGYNETGDYFIIKNSWGTGFGMNGFGYLKSWVVLNDTTILNRLRFATGADQLNNKGVIPMNSGTPFYTTTQNPYDCGNLNEGETCSVTWQVNATGFHLSDWDFFVIINSDDENLTGPNSTITIIGDYIPVIESIECETEGSWNDCSSIGHGTDLTRIRVNVTDENSNIQNVNVRLKEDGIVIAEGSAAYSSGFYVFNNADQTVDSNKDYIIEVDASDETYSINGFILFEPTAGCVEDWQVQYDLCQTNDEQLKYYIDSNACGTINDLPADNGTYVLCDYCSYSVVNTTWSGWSDMELCQLNDTKMQARTKTEYDENYNTCYAVTGLPADLWNGGSNITYIDTQTIVCDYCIPSWVEINESCQPDDTITGWYNDTSECYAQTGLAGDLSGKPANNTYTCNFANDAPVLDPISNVVVDETDLVQINPSATDVDVGDVLTYSFEAPLNSTGGWQTDYSCAGSYDVNVSVDDGNGGVDWQMVNILVNDVAVADLSVKYFLVQGPRNPVANDFVMLSFLIENIGVAAANSIDWVLDFGNSDSASGTIASLNPGEESSIMMRKTNYTSAQTYNAVISVDPLNSITELNETNNDKTKSVIIS